MVQYGKVRLGIIKMVLEDYQPDRNVSQMEKT